jgi:type II secretory pathway component PulF
MAFSAAQKHLFYTEIAKLLEAGFGIRDAARAMLDTRLPAAQAALLKEMDHDLETGKSITDAFSKNRGAISDLEKSIIGAGERGGRLAPAFQHLADYFGMLANARRDALQSMIYPVVMLHLGMFISFVPALFSGEKSSAEVMAGFAATMLVVYAVVFFVWLGIRALLASATVNPGIDAMLNRIPVIGGARRSMAMARFTKVYHTCLLAGLSMWETVETSADASRSGLIREASRKMLEVLKDRGALGPVYVSSGAFPSAFARSYATAEEAGSLDKDFARWAKVFQEDAARGTKTLSVALPKLFYVLILLFMAWKIISFYSENYLGPLRDLEQQYDS